MVILARMISQTTTKHRLKEPGGPRFPGGSGVGSIAHHRSKKNLNTGAGNNSLRTCSSIHVALSVSNSQTAQGAREQDAHVWNEPRNCF
jgi:hypothetical protein